MTTMQSSFFDGVKSLNLSFRVHLSYEKPRIAHICVQVFSETFEAKLCSFFAFKNSTFCLKKRIIGYTRTQTREEEEEVCSLFLRHRVWFNNRDLSEREGFFTSREVRGVGFFRSR